MLDIHSLMKNLKRPKILVQAARFGLDDFKRHAELQRLLKRDQVPTPSRAIIELIDLENEINARRVSHDATYQLAEHINVLTAIMSEQRLLTENVVPIR